MSLLSHLSDLTWYFCRSSSLVRSYTLRTTTSFEDRQVAYRQKGGCNVAKRRLEIKGSHMFTHTGNKTQQTPSEMYGEWAHASHLEDPGGITVVQLFGEVKVPQAPFGALERVRKERRDAEQEST